MKNPYFWLMAILLVVLWFPTLCFIENVVAGKGMALIKIEGTSDNSQATTGEKEKIKSAIGCSLLVGVPAALLASVIGLCCVYILRKPKAANLGGVILLIPLMTPPRAMGIAFASLRNCARLDPGLIPIIMAHVYLFLPIAYYLHLLRFKDLSASRFECAQNLGARRWQIFRHVVLPHQRIAFFAAFLMCLAFSWGEPIIANSLAGTNSTFAVVIMQMMRSALSNRVYTAAGMSFLATLVPVIVGAFILWNATNLARKEKQYE